MVDILYEDKNLLFCIKDAGLLSEAGKDSIVELLEAHTGGTVYPVHRLDRGVGGLMVYAKSSSAAAHLSAQIQKGTFVKEYLAIVKDSPEDKVGSFSDLLFHDRRANKSYVVSKKRTGVKEALLDFCLAETAETEKGRFSLVRIRLHTGRTHQIRVQFSSRKMPLYGDGKYGGRSAHEGIGLWSYRISLSLPFSEKPFSMEALPPDNAPWNFFDLTKISK